MQGSFEKRVQEKLEELKLTPSEPVWKNIEKEIRPEKSRRRFPFWVPFLMLLLAGTTWWLLATDDGQTPDAASSTVTSTPGASSAGQNEVKQQAGTTTTTTQDRTTAITQPDNKVSTATPLSAAAKTTLQPVTDTKTRGQYAGFAGRDKANEPARVAMANGEKEQRQRDLSTFQNTAEGNITVQTENKQVKITPALSATNRSDSVQQVPANHSQDALPATTDPFANIKKEPEDSVQNVADTIAARKKPAVAKKGWQKTVTLEGGWSRPSAGLLAGSGGLMNYDASPSTGSNNGVVRNAPNPLTGSTAARIGIGLSNPLHARWEVSIGLQYAYYSTRTRVGEYKPIDTAVSSFNGRLSLGGYYKNNHQQNYTNRYHILELPVGIGFRPLARLPLTIQVGASYGRLLQSNALAFDTRANIYYTDKHALPKNFFAGYSSLQYAVLQKSGWRLQAGPVVQYHFSRLQQVGNSPQRLFFAGLKTSIYF